MNGEQHPIKHTLSQSSSLSVKQKLNSHESIILSNCDFLGNKCRSENETVPCCTCHFSDPELRQPRFKWDSMIHFRLCPDHSFADHCPVDPYGITFFPEWPERDGFQFPYVRGRRNIEAFLHNADSSSGLLRRSGAQRNSFESPVSDYRNLQSRLSV
jgi:hypothetical protein